MASAEQVPGDGFILLVPCLERGRGGGHLSRCLALAAALNERGREAYLWVPGDAREEALKIIGSLAAGFDSGRIMSALPPASQPGFIVLDKFRTSRAEFNFWSALAPLAGIDEGGPCRESFDFLLDLLPSLRGVKKAKLCAPWLLPLPQNRRAAFCPDPLPSWKDMKILVSFGAEDPAGLSLPVVRAIASESPAGITLAAPAMKGGPEAAALPPGVRVLEARPDLKERFADYDLLVTHFGLGAFEALYARVPVLLVAPTAYHERLGKNAGLPCTGRGLSGARHLNRLLSRPGFYEALCRACEESARRYGLDADKTRSLGDYLAGCFPGSPRPPGASLLARFPERSYWRLKGRELIVMKRLTPPPVEYAADYFFGFYKSQYGKTYLEDFPNLAASGRRRLTHIRALLASGSPRSLLGFAHKTLKNRRLGDFLPCKLRKEPDNRGFDGFFSEKSHQNLQVQQAPSVPALLDIGCAYGPFLAAARDGGFAPLGLEPAEDAARYVRERLNIPCIHGFFPESLPGGAPPFDAVTLWYVIEHFEDSEKALAGIRRILKPGGVLAFSTPSFSGISGRKSLSSFLEKSPQDHWTIWSPRTCASYLKKQGFTVKKILVTGHHPERFPLAGPFLRRESPLYRLFLALSRLFRLGDTFEVYAVKTGAPVPLAEKLNDSTGPLDIIEG
jgi:SAM-dependent methyltransferase